MKKLHVGLLILSDGWGGGEEVVYQLAQQLLKSKVRVTLFINTGFEKGFADLKGLTINLIGRVNYKNKFVQQLSYLDVRRRFIKALRSCAPDLIHAHLGGSLPVCLGLPKDLKKPIIFTLHGQEIKNYYKRPGSLYYWLLKRMFVQAAAVISPSGWQVKKLKRKYRQKIVILPNGVDARLFRPLKGKKETKVILFVGRYVELKGIRQLLEVAKQLSKFKFWFVGYGPLAKQMTGPNVKDLGFKTRAELVRLYNQATICCFPSHWENFSLVGLEAMACGRPVVVTRKGFSEYVVAGKDGLMVGAKDVTRLKMAILRLMNSSSLRQRLGKGARQKALWYDWRLISQKHLWLYRSVWLESKA